MLISVWGSFTVAIPTPCKQNYSNEASEIYYLLRLQHRCNTCFSSGQVEHFLKTFFMHLHVWKAIRFKEMNECKWTKKKHFFPENKVFCSLRWSHKRSFLKLREARGIRLCTFLILMKLIGRAFFIICFGILARTCRSRFVLYEHSQFPQNSLAMQAARRLAWFRHILNPTPRFENELCK